MLIKLQVYYLTELHFMNGQISKKMQKIVTTIKKFKLNGSNGNKINLYYVPNILK